MLKVYIVKRITHLELDTPSLHKHFCNEGYYLEFRMKGISYIQWKEGTVNGLVRS